MAQRQYSLLDHIEKLPPLPPIHFSGSTYEIAFDCKRLNAQQRRVYDCMIDGRYRTLRDIAAVTGDPEASISARLRGFNNHEYLKQFFIMESKRMPGAETTGIWLYRVLVRS